MGEFRMPSLGADMEEGTLVEWAVDVGDQVSKGDIIASVETDKSTIEVEVFESGTVAELLVEPGARVAVGTPMARIGDSSTAGSVGPDSTGRSGESPSETPPVDARPPEAPTAVREEQHAAVVGDGPNRRHASVLRSPLVRQLAERLQVDTSRIRGTGPGGSVTRKDVELASRRTATPATSERSRRVTPRARRRAAEIGVDLSVVVGTGVAGAIREQDVNAAATPRDETRTEAAGGSSTDRMRAAIARTMERSNRDIPHYHLSLMVDLEPLDDWLTDRNAGRRPQERALPAAAILRASAMAAASVPELNGEWRDGSAVTSQQVHLGVLVSLRSGGLVAPVLHDAQDRSVDELMAALLDVVERARRGALRSSELAGATITVTNLGDRGVDEVLGVIHPPQLAIVGVGKIASRPMVVDGEVRARKSAVITLGADHRATDGRTGSRFLRRVDALLRDPTLLEPNGR